MLLKTARRDLLKGKVYSAITIAGLGIAMAAATLNFLWVQNEYRFDAYHSNANRIYRLNAHL
jgi:putative ABC transport system permease protein